MDQADDTCLLSNDIFRLFNILHLTMNYCKQYNVELCATKTKLVMISPTNQPVQIPISPISIYGQKIAPSHQAEHVGVIRSDQSSSPAWKNLSHKKAKFAILSSGISRGHRGNPAAAIVFEKIYALPVLLTGDSSLYRTGWEVYTIDSFYKTTLSDLLKGTPQAFVYFMSGSLPGTALIHQRQLSQFGMICNLRNNSLHQRARHALSLVFLQNISPGLTRYETSIFFMVCLYPSLF